MPQAKSTNTDSAWAKAFRTALTKSQKIPDGTGWLTTLQIAAKIGASKQITQKWVKAQIESGNMERFVGSQVTKSGHITMQIWHRLKIGKPQ